MKKLTHILGISIFLLISSEALADTPSRCFVTGGGVISPGDVFAVNAMFMKDGTTRGSVTLLTPYGYTFQSSNNVDRLRCTEDGGAHAAPPEAPQLARFDGSGRWNGEDGFRVVVFTEDRGEPTDIDYFEVRIFDSDGILVYQSGGFVTMGNIQHQSINDGHP